MRRNMIADINWFLAEPAPKLADMSYRDVVQAPEHVLIESGVMLLQSDFDAVGQKIVLPN